ncbi:hypothetical protein, partial [Methylorubrum podarium]|uniref:hypothetical protein n=1 Tax=Methylorubrum podarium TaxID=200476 RepID=UPI001EE168E8
MSVLVSDCRRFVKSRVGDCWLPAIGLHSGRLTGDSGSLASCRSRRDPPPRAIPPLHASGAASIALSLVPPRGKAAGPVYRLTDIAISNWYLIRREQIRIRGAAAL